MRINPSQRIITATTAVLALAASPALAADATWNQTGGTHDWNSTANWLPNTTFPNGAGEVADVNNNITAGQTVRLQQGITVGTLNLGDSDGTHAFTISSGTGTQTLTFEAATPGGATALSVGGTGTVSNAIASNVSLGGTSNLTLNYAGTQNLNFTGTLNLNGNTMTLTGTGGSMGIGTNSSNGGITGIGTLIKNNTGVINANSGLTDFTGSIIVNVGSLTIVNGQLSTTSVTLNGHLNPAGAFSHTGGSLTTGSGTPFATPPNNRLPTNLTLNGGHLNAGGQPISDVVDTVTDEVSSLNINSAYSMITVQRGGDDNRVVDVATLTRGAGATAAVRSSNLAAEARLLIANINTGNDGGSFLVGGGGAAGTTTMSIIPWMTAANTNGSAANPLDWATYIAGSGIRGLTSSEYVTPANTAALLALDSTSNVKSNNGLGDGQSKTLNSLQRTSSGVVNIGAGSVLTLTSGALGFSLNTAGMGVAGDAAAGTVNFGTAEGVIWSISTNTNTMGSVIAGSNGLIKAGTGILVLQAANTYTGRTYVSAGTLQVGDGTFYSNLGVTGDVGVAVGALLKLLNGDAIHDGASLILEAHGLYNGKVEVDADIVETVGALSLGGAFQGAGYYGSTAAATAYTGVYDVIVNDTYFSGSGLIHVVPEPASMLLLAAGSLLMGVRRRA